MRQSPSAPPLRRILLCLALAGVSCSGSAPNPGTGGTGPAPPAASACDLLTTQEIEEATGGSVEAGTGSEVSCRWQGAPGQIGVGIAVVPSADPATCVGRRPDRAEPLMDLGLEAWWELNETGATVGTLTVCLEEAHMTLTLSGDAEPKAFRRAARELAAIAVGRSQS